MPRGIRWGALVGLFIAGAATVPGRGQGTLQPALFRGGPERSGYAREAVAPPLTLLWKFSTFETYRNSSAPIVTADGKVFFAVNKNLYALDANTGEPLWKKKNQDGTYTYSYPSVDSISSPLAFFPPNLLLVGTKSARENSLLAIDTDKGGVAWPFNAGGGVYSSPVSTGPGQILFATTSGAVWGGTISSEGMADTWKVALGGNVQGALAAAGGLAFAVSSDTLYGIHIAGRRVIWSAPMGDASQNGPVLVGDQVIVAAGEKLVSYAQKTGTRLWTVPISAGRVNATPAARGTTLYFGADEYLYAYDITQRRSPWRTTKIKLDGRILASPYVTDTGVFAGTVRGFLAGVNTEGALLWNYKMPTSGTTANAVSVPPLIANGKLYVLGDDGTLFCFSAENVDIGTPEVVEASVRLIARDRKSARYFIDPYEDYLGPDELFVIPGKGPVGFEFKLEDLGSGINWETVRVFLDDVPLKLKTEPIADASVNPGKSTVTVELKARPMEGTSGVPLPDGVRKVRIHVKNWAGNELVDTRAFRVDNGALPPEPPVRDPAAGPGGTGDGGLGGLSGGAPAGRGGARGGGGARGSGGSGSGS